MKLKSNENVKNNSGVSRFSKWMTSNRFFVVCFILLVLKVLPGHSGNRMMGGVVWILVGLLLIWQIFKWYGPPSKWLKLAGKWIQNNKLVAFFWALLVGGLLISCLGAVFSIQQYTNMELEQWIISDKKPLGASIRSVYDEQLQKNVVEFSGAGQKDSFRMGNALYRKKVDSESFIFEWHMKFDSPFKIFITVQIDRGRRVLLYTADERSRLVIGKNRRAVHHGLGENARNGEWQTIVRDLQSDLQEGDPAAKIEKVIDFRIRGNGRIDDRGLMKAFGWAWKNQQLPLALLVSALACYMFLFLSYWLFRLSHGDEDYLWVLVLMIVVNAIPFWQKLDYDSIRFLLNCTVAADVLNQKEIPSVLRTVTTYSPFAAVLAVFFWGRFLMKKSVGIYRHAELFVALLATCSALLAGSRTGILSLFLGFLALAFYVPGRRKWWVLYGVLIAVVVIHAFALWHPYLGKKMGMVFPYITKLRHHKPLTPNDFVPDFTAGYSGKKLNRLIRIKESFALWQENPWFGVGLGQYNIVSGHKWIGNVHNLFMNILCEAGIFVFVAWLYLAGRFVWRLRRSCLMAVVVSIFVVSCFENLFDHSMPWVLTCAWIFSREGKWIS